MKVLELHNRIKGCGLSVEDGIIYNQGLQVGKIRTYRGQIEEISATPEIDDRIASAVLGIE